MPSLVPTLMILVRFKCFMHKKMKGFLKVSKKRINTGEKSNVNSIVGS